MYKPIIVISAVNLVEGGPLSILEDAVQAFVHSFINDYRFIVIVNRKDLLAKFSDKVELIEYSYPKKSWFCRIWFEYVHSWFISKKINADLWVALHDMTPNVFCKHQVVYCHNAAAFYKPGLKEILHEKKLLFFCCFYSLFYRINIRRNDAIIVQQQWMREQFIRRYDVKKVIVAHPKIHYPASHLNPLLRKHTYQFFYPSYPRAFKNFEVLLKAAEILFNCRKDFKVLITVKGNENRYSKSLLKKYGNLTCVKFLGIQERDTVWNLYNEVDCLVFASKLETWGLPITEIQFFNKPMLVAKASYTAESIGNYPQFCYFNLNDPIELSRLMSNAIDNKLLYHEMGPGNFQKPVLSDWEQLYSYLFQQLFGYSVKKFEFEVIERN